MSWQVVWTRPAADDMRRLDREVSQRIYRAVHRFADTERGDLKRLRGTTEEWRLRVGDWRVRFLFDRQTQTMKILRVLHRSSAYRN